MKNIFNWEQGFTIDFDLNTGMSKKKETTKRYLSNMRGMFADDEAMEKEMAKGDPLVYEFHEMNAPENPGDLAFGISITYPGKVGNEYYMTKGHFHTIIDTAEVYYTLDGEGLLMLESLEGDWSVQPLKPGETVYVPKRYAHRTINTGNKPLRTFFVFRGDAGHDYGTIETKGYRRLVVEKDGKPTCVPNPKWKSDRMKILITPTSFLTSVNAKAKEKIEAFAGEVVYNTTGKPLQPDQLKQMLEGVDGYIAGVDYITAEVIEQAPESLKVISRYGAGIDRVDVAACTKRGIKVANTPGTNSVAVAELAFALMLDVARNIPQLHETVQKGEWIRSEGIELRGKALGIVGLGSIGKNLATRAIAFGMTVQAYDPFFDETFAAQYGIKKAKMDEVIQRSDFISLHVPLTDQTKYLIDADMIAKMKDGAIIINTARGGIIDEAAAAEAVKSGKLGGLGLDAFEQEPLINSPLKGLPRVIFTPHTGAHTAEAVEGMGMMAVDNCIDILSGKDNPYILNK